MVQLLFTKSLGPFEYANLPPYFDAYCYTTHTLQAFLKLILLLLTLEYRRRDVTLTQHAQESRARSAQSPCVDPFPSVIPSLRQPWLTTPIKYFVVYLELPIAQQNLPLKVLSKTIPASSTAWKLLA